MGRRRQSTATKGTGILQRSDVAVRAPTLPTNEQSDLTKKPGTMNNQELVTGGVGESGSAGDVSVGLVAATATRTTSVKDCRVGAEVVAKLDDGEVEHAAPDAMVHGSVLRPVFVFRTNTLVNGPTLSPILRLTR